MRHFHPISIWNWFFVHCHLHNDYDSSTFSLLSPFSFQVLFFYKRQQTCWTPLHCLTLELLSFYHILSSIVVLNFCTMYEVPKLSLRKKTHIFCGNTSTRRKMYLTPNNDGVIITPQISTWASSNTLFSFSSLLMQLPNCVASLCNMNYTYLPSLE